MRVRLLVFAGWVALGVGPALAVDTPLPPGMYVCRSPLLAYGFWDSVLHVSQELKIKLTPAIVAQLAADQGYTDRNGRGPHEPVCIRVNSVNLRPIKSGWGGSLAMADGDKSPIYFHSPDTLGWVHPQYFVEYSNDRRLGESRENGWKHDPDQVVVPEGNSPDGRGRDEGVIHPRLYYKTEPEYTPVAKARRIEGIVVLSLEVRPDGTTNNIRVLKSLDPGLDWNAIEAVRLWRFQPGTKDGRPVSIPATVEVNFQLF